MRHLLFFVVLPVIAAAAPSHDLQVVSKLPVRFERSGPGEFVGLGFGYRVEVTPAGYHMTLPRRDGDRQISLTFSGANLGAQASAEAPFTAKTNYLIGNRRSDWRTGVTSFARVRYAEALPGIDLVYYGNAGQFEFDLVVRQGADPRRIVMNYAGQDALSVDRNGNLRIQIDGEEVVQQLPVVYQRAGESLRLISGEYVVSGPGRVTFELGPYDSSQPLVIDPVVIYSGFVSAAGTDTAIAVQRDSDGWLYVAGNTRATGLTTIGVPYASSNGGEQDIFVAKIHPLATPPDDLVYLTYIGGTAIDEVKAMVMTSPGVLYLAGSTYSSDFPVSSGAAQSTQKGDRDAFWLKLDLSLEGTSALAYSTFYGGNGIDAANAITVDGEGNVYVAGFSGSTDLVAGSDAAQQYAGGGWDALLLIYNSSGAVTYSTFLGADKTDVANAVAVDKDGSVLIAGSTFSAGFPLAGASFDVNYHDGGGDAFIARIAPNQGLDGFLYATFLGGDGADEIRQMAFNAAGKLVVSGTTASNDFPTGQAALRPSRPGATDLFLAVLDLRQPQGAALTYSTYFGGSDTEIPYDMKFDAAGNLLLTGYTLSTDFPVTGGAYQSTSGGAADAFIATVDPSKAGAGALVYSTYLGGNQTDIGYGITSDSAGNLYTVGATRSRRFPASAGGDRSGFYPGDYDAFAFVMQPCTVTLSPAFNNVPAAGGDFQLLVTAGSECTWTASPTAAWIRIKDAGSGKGNGAVTYSVDANDSASSRTAAVFVTNQSHAVTQSGKP